MIIEFLGGSEQRGMRCLFAGVCLVIPTPAWFWFASGYVPVAAYLPVLLGGVTGFVLAALHLLVYGGILHVLSRALAALIFRCLSTPARRCWGIAGVFGLLLGVALCPVYSPVSHRGDKWMNWFELATHFPFLKG